MRRVVALLEDAVVRGIFPGAQLVVGDAGEPVLRHAAGTLARGDSPSVTLDTIYDTASLTKAVVTATLVLRLVERNVVDLYAPAAKWIPALAAGEKMYIRVRDLLAHASGLPAWRPLFQQIPAGAARDRLTSLAAAEPLEAPPGARSVYSDLGFILLGTLVERAGGARLDELARREIFAPLGMTRSRFVDLRAADRPSPVAPTELGTPPGEVHDENCRAAGGIAGHAGLFSTADDLARFARSLLAAHHGRGGAFPRELVARFWAPSGVPGSTWRLGWDGPAEAGSAAGDGWPKDGVLHLGFTGCSLVIDPARERWVVLLTNRVHPGRGDDRIREFRPILHQAVIDALP